MPSKSQIALALEGKNAVVSFRPGGKVTKAKEDTGKIGDPRIGVYLSQESTAIVPIEYAREAPRLLLERLYILDLHDQDVTWLGGLDLKGPGKIVDLGEIDVLHVIGAIVIADLAPGPVDAFDFDHLAILNGSVERDCIWDGLIFPLMTRKYV